MCTVNVLHPECLDSKIKFATLLLDVASYVHNLFTPLFPYCAVLYTEEEKKTFRCRGSRITYKVRAKE